MKIAVTILVFILSLSMISSVELLGTRTLNECGDIITSCPNCTYMNITKITNPRGSSVLNNVAMTKDGTSYNYTFCNNSILGTYTVYSLGDLDGEETNLAFTYDVTATGISFEQKDAILYVILFIGSFAIFLLAFWGAIVIPFSNKRDENYVLIGIERAKYWKFVMIGLSYGLLVWNLNLLLALSNNFAILTPFVGFFSGFFTILTSLSWPFLAFILLYMAISIIKDAKLEKMLQRGLSPR